MSRALDGVQSLPLAQSLERSEAREGAGAEGPGWIGIGTVFFVLLFCVNFCVDLCPDRKFIKNSFLQNQPKSQKSIPMHPKAIDVE